MWGGGGRRGGRRGNVSPWNLPGYRKATVWCLRVVARAFSRPANHTDPDPSPHLCFTSEKSTIQKALRLRPREG